MPETFHFKDSTFHSRADWAMYEGSINKVIPETRRVVFHSWKIPHIQHLGTDVTQIAIVINSNLGIKGSTGAERTNVLGGSTVRQFVLNKSEDGSWINVLGANHVDYVSESMTFTFRLRMYIRGTGYINIPLLPKKQWEVELTIV